MRADTESGGPLLRCPHRECRSRFPNSAKGKNYLSRHLSKCRRGGPVIHAKCPVERQRSTLQEPRSRGTAGYAPPMKQREHKSGSGLYSLGRSIVEATSGILNPRRRREIKVGLHRTGKDHHRGKGKVRSD